MNIFYVYVYWIDDVPFYVGKGSKNRFNDHLSQRKGRRRATVMRRKIDKLRREGRVDNIEITFFIQDVTEQEALFWEEFLILSIGRKITHTGPLCNILVGGQATSLSSGYYEEKVRRLQAGSICWRDGGWGVYLGKTYLGRFSTYYQAEKARVDACKALHRGTFDNWLQWLNHHREIHRATEQPWSLKEFFAIQVWINNTIAYIGAGKTALLYTYRYPQPSKAHYEVWTQWKDGDHYIVFFPTFRLAKQWASAWKKQYTTLMDVINKSEKEKRFHERAMNLSAGGVHYVKHRNSWRLSFRRSDFGGFTTKKEAEQFRLACCVAYRLGRVDEFLHDLRSYTFAKRYNPTTEPSSFIQACLQESK